jgi:hypothetical protein
LCGVSSRIFNIVCHVDYDNVDLQVIEGHPEIVVDFSSINGQRCAFSAHYLLAIFGIKEVHDGRDHFWVHVRDLKVVNVPCDRALLAVDGLICHTEAVGVNFEVQFL